MLASSKNSNGVSVSLFATLLAALFCLFTIAPKATLAQSSSTGTVSGTVTDNTGAVVPDAAVTLTDKATGNSRTATSTSSGQYIFAYVNPGTYDVKVGKQGFQTTVVSNQVVQVGLQLTVNVKLQIGSVSTTVEVTSIPGADLQTMDATVGTTLSGDLLKNLANVSREASTLAVLQPGQNINGATGGVETDQNSFQLDGGFATDDMSGDNNTYIASFGSDTAGGIGAYHSPGTNQAPSAVVPMPVSSIQEFKVSTANQTADFNGGAGSQVQLVTKSGTNVFHGGVYDYYLDNNFGGANTFDNNRRGIKQPSSHFSRFGADAGGKIPGVNFLGGGWFIFGNYEGFRFPQSSVFTRAFPLPSMRAGIIHLDKQTINLNTTPTMDPGCGPAVTQGCQVTAANGYTQVGQMVAPSGLDTRGLGMNPVIQTLWNTYLPLPTDCTTGDSLNYCGYSAAISTPQKSDFGVARIDHDFAKNWHFNATYHYYRLTNTVSDQWDIGGFFPGDVKGQYSAIRQKPQVPWIYTAGLTTEISSSVTNDFHFSYTRNWWAYGSPSGVPNVAGYPAALEIGGENSGATQATSPLFGPYNTNNQSVRTRYWNGHDSMYRDDVTWIKGNHLFQLGGMYLRANDTHLRNDNGQSINTFEQYIIGNGFSNSLTGLNVSIPVPGAITDSTIYQNLYSEILGMVDQSQSLYTRGLGSLITGLPLATRAGCSISGITATSGCFASPSLGNTSIIPTYNLYFTDSWHLKPTFSLNYGLGYTVEMPPYEVNGGVQTVMVDQNNNILSAEKYLNNEEQAALQGNAFAPLIGFSTVRNVNGHSRYPYDSFFGGLSPRIGMAWNLKPDTVVRAGYSRIFGRINGVDPVLVPMLTPGLMQPATCLGPQNTGGNGGNGNGSCSTTAAPSSPTSAFRVGVDGVNAPLPAPSMNLPQPWYPGFNDVGTGSGETIDPNFKPDRSDEFTLSVQHQFGPRIIAEAGYIGRILSNEMQYYSLTNVPYMMTRGGQTFANAWAQLMVATNYGTNTVVDAAPPVQPFFESSLSPAYCSGSFKGGVTGLSSCTAEFVAQNSNLGKNHNMRLSDPFDAWAGVSNLGAWTFGRSFTSDPIPGSPFGANGQSPSIVTQASNGNGNYNAGYLQLTFSDWHGLTMKTNFSYSNALGTGDFTQASSSRSSVDNFNIQNNYGPQTYNEKFVFNLFLNYAEPFFKGQNGLAGRLLGGWNFSPLFVYGSGFPVRLGTANSNCGSFGECNRSQGISALENGVITQNLNYSATTKQAKGTSCGISGAGLNVFSNPQATCPVGGGIFGDPVRSPILGLDGQIGGGGPVTGLPFWNLDLGINKKINVTERLSGSLYFDFTNVLNHMQPRDPSLNIASPKTWGVLGGGGNVQANTPRQLQLGVSIDW